MRGSRASRCSSPLSRKVTTSVNCPTVPTARTSRDLTSGNLWKGWFQPFFDFIRKNTDIIRAVGYLNDGTAQVQANKGILDRWKTEIIDPRYLQAAPELFEKVGYTAAQP